MKQNKVKLSFNDIFKITNYSVKTFNNKTSFTINNIYFDNDKKGFIIEKNNNRELLNFENLIKCFLIMNKEVSINPATLTIHGEYSIISGLLFTGKNINTESLLFTENYIFDFIKIFKSVDNNVFNTIYEENKNNYNDIFKFIKFIIFIILDKIKDYKKTTSNDCLYLTFKYIEINNFVTELLLNENLQYYEIIKNNKDDKLNSLSKETNSTDYKSFDTDNKTIKNNNSYTDNIKIEKIIDSNS